jgi:hypothetical protein
MVTILDYTSSQETDAGNNFARCERDHPEVAEQANELCKLLGLHGLWRRVNSARWEIAKQLLLAKGVVVDSRPDLSDMCGTATTCPCAGCCKEDECQDPHQMDRDSAEIDHNDPIYQG